MPLRTPNNLFPDARRQRFLAEITAHVEDAENVHAVGNTDVLISHFNMYAIERRHRAAIRYAVIILSIALLTTYSALYLHQENGTGGWQLIFAMPGILLAFLPIVLTTLFVPLVWLKTLWLIPIASTIMWAIIIYMLSFNPPALLSRNSHR